MCWEHSRIPDIAAHIPLATGVDVPRVWPGDRFDVIWRFALAADDGGQGYHFTALPEVVLLGDAPA